MNKMTAICAAMAAAVTGTAMAADAYLESSGSQAINTGYHVTARTRIVADYAFVNASTKQQRVFGAASDDASAVLSCAHYINGGGQYAWAFQDGKGNWVSTGVGVTTARRTLDLDGMRGTLALLTDGATTYSGTFTTQRSYTSVRPLAIFANTTDATGTSFDNFGHVRLYSFAIYEGGRLVRYYKPYRSVDGTTLGLKDLVTGAVLTDAAGGATPFSCGGDIGPEPACDLEGYRLNGGTLEWRLRVEPGAEGITRVDGTVLTAAREEWNAVGTVATHALEAAEAEGFIQAGWTGDATVAADGTVTCDAACTVAPRYWAIATPVHVVEVASGTLDLAQWIADNGAALSGGGTLVKQGAGTLAVTTAALADFTGDVYVKEGELQTFVANPLGPAGSGRIVVERGATLHHAWPAGATAGPSFGNKPVYARGTGVGGKGAVYVTVRADNKDSGNPGLLYLLDDAKISWNRHTRINGNVYLEGHTLSVSAPAGWDYWQPTLYDTTGRGGIDILREVLLQGLSPQFGSPANVLKIEPSASFRTFNWQPAHGTWTLDFGDNAKIYPSGGATVWKGPVILRGRSPLLRQNEWASMEFRGVVSGPGSIGKYGDTGSGAYSCHHMQLTLGGTANTFTGGLWLYNNVLFVGGNGSIPAAGGGLTNYLGSVIFKSTGPYDLPEAYFSGTGRVYSASGVGLATGAWRKQMVKAGAGVLAYDCSIGAPFLDVGGTGAFRYPAAGEGVVPPAFAKINVSNGATLDANGNAVSVAEFAGLGTVAGGALSVAAKYHVSGTGLAAGQTLQVTGGALAFGADATICLQDVDRLDRNTTYTLATASGGITPQRIPTDAKDWFAHVVDGALQLYHAGGTTLIIR